MSPVVSIYRFAGLEKMYAGICKAMDEELRGVWNWWQEELEAGNGVGNENGKETEN